MAEILTKNFVIVIFVFKLISAQRLPCQPIITETIIETTSPDKCLCKELSLAIQNAALSKFTSNAYKQPLFGQMISPLLKDISSSVNNCPFLKAIQITPEGYTTGFVPQETVKELLGTPCTCGCKLDANGQIQVASCNCGSKPCNCGNLTPVKPCICGSSPCICGSNVACTCGSTPCSCGSNANLTCNCGSSPCNCGSNPCNCGSNPCNCGSNPCNCGSVTRSCTCASVQACNCGNTPCTCLGQNCNCGSVPCICGSVAVVPCNCGSTPCTCKSSPAIPCNCGSLPCTCGSTSCICGSSPCSCAPLRTTPRAIEIVVTKTPSCPAVSAKDRFFYNIFKN